MSKKIKSNDQVNELVRRHIEQIQNVRLREAVVSTLIEPKLQSRTYTSQDGEISSGLWVFSIIPNTSVGIAYAEDAFGEPNLSWGLVFISGNDFGNSGAWYHSLLDLLEDSGHFTDFC